MSVRWDICGARTVVGTMETRISAICNEGVMAKPKLIACDIDGTLLMAGQSALSRETAALIRRVIDAGIVFAPASGRQFVGLKTLFAQFDGEISYVAENGSIAYVGKELVHRVALDRDLGDEIARTILSRSECEMYVAGVETCYVMPKSPSYVAHLTDILRFDVTVVDDIADIDEPALKVSAYHAAFDPDLAFWKQRFGTRCNVMLSSPDWIDFSPAGASKAAGVEAICKRLGIDPADCVAFGDADNDAPMFDLVGHPIAMEHASAKARACAVETTSSVNDSLARILGGM